jgi:hypothetical protein
LVDERSHVAGANTISNARIEHDFKCAHGRDGKPSEKTDVNLVFAL